MRKWVILIVIGLVSSVVGCSSKSLPTPTPTSTPIILTWNTSPTARIIRIAEMDGYGATIYDHNFYIPEVQIWGDGHILWIPNDATSGWHILEGQLTPEQMKTVLQQIVDSGFFGWKHEYDAPLGVHAAPMHIIVSLTDHTTDVMASAQESGSGNYPPTDYFKLIDFLRHGAGAVGHDYVPTRAYLTSGCGQVALSTHTPTPGSTPVGPTPTPFPLDPNLPVWPIVETGFSLDEIGSGRYIEGAALSFAWQTIRPYPEAPIFVTLKGHVCNIMLQIPGVSFYEPPTK